MRYQSTTGLDEALFADLVMKVEAVFGGRKRFGRPSRLSLAEQVEISLLILRQNMAQATVADLFHVGQSTICRIFKRMCSLLEHITDSHRFSSLTEAIKGQVVLVDGTDIPTGKRTGHSNNFSGKRHRHGVSIQVVSTL